MRPKEVVHLALGTPANHVATHFWNTQEAYMDYAPSSRVPLVDHDVSFREGLGVHGTSTYTPRALFFDVRQEFGTLRTRNALYGAEEDDELRKEWEGEVIHTSDPVEPSWYAEQLRQEDEGIVHEAPQGRPIRYWSDYSRCPLHPRSLVPVSAPSLHGSTFLEPGIQSFDTYEQGYSVAQAMEKDHAILDENVRWLAEDSDLMQAFQMTASGSDAFSGVTAAYLSWLADEYPKTERVVFNVASSSPKDDSERSSRLRSIYAMNCVLSLASSLDLATLLVPMAGAGAPSEYVHCNFDSVYERSAVLATYLESATLGTRLREMESWGRIVSQLNWRRDTKIAQLGGVFPTPLLAPVRSAKDGTDALIEAMFAARNMRVEAEQPQPTTNANALANAWHDASQDFSQDIRCAVSEGEQVPIKTERATPFAESLVARDADSLAEAPTRAAIHEWNSAQSPLLHTYVTI